MDLTYVLYRKSLVTGLDSLAHSSNIPPILSVQNWTIKFTTTNRYILSETRRYHIHLQSHQLDCKVCGAHFTNCQLRKFHERSHKEGSFYCPNSRCNYVGRSQKSIESHVRYKHTPEQCKYCGKGFKNMKSLTLHQEVFHLPNRPKEHQCEHCGKAYRYVI